MSQQNNALIEVRTYNALIAAFQARADEMEITRDTIDAVAHLPPGYTAKLLGAKQVKYLGGNSLGALLSILRLKLIVVADQCAPVISLPRRRRAARGRHNPVNPR